jgi:hypothetical protein
MAVADYYGGGACFRTVAALFTRLDFENTHTHHYQRCLRTTNSTTFSAILLSRPSMEC